MTLEKLTLLGEMAFKSNEGKIVSVVPIGNPVDIIVSRKGNVWSPSDEEISKYSPEGTNAYAMGERRIVLSPGHEYGFTFQYYRIK